MTLFYASTFTDALARLSGPEQKQVKLAAFDLQMDPRGNGLQMHRIEKTLGFWSVRVSSDIRIILHKENDITLLAYVDHHDDAYRWAERKRLVTHERTGAMQFVEIPVIQGEPVILTAAAVEQPKPAAAAPARYPFTSLTDDQMLDVGVPRDWLVIVRGTQEELIFDLFEKLPSEAAEALLDHATGGRIEQHVTVKTPGANPYTHPDALRRFRVVENLEELKAALDQPFEKWAVFLHPAQRTLVERSWSGPVRVSGSAGTGKTIVALHRAAYLAKARGQKVLLTTFSKSLAAALLKRQDILALSEPSSHGLVTVSTLDEIVFEIYEQVFGRPNMATAEALHAAIEAAQSAGLGKGFTPDFLFEEWDELVDPWGVDDGVAYAKIPRLGRRTRLGSAQRESAWQVFTFIKKWLAERDVISWPQLYARLVGKFLEQPELWPFTYVVVDEAQDISVAQARFLAAIGRQNDEALFFTGDQGQRIFHLPFSWLTLGIDVRGRSQSLKVNYRTSHQIRSAADRLLPGSISDADGVEEGRRGTVSVFDGPEPSVIMAENEAEEIAAVSDFLRSCTAEGMAGGDLAILVRSEKQFKRARSAALEAGLYKGDGQSISIVTMHDAKGLEFKAVVVMACDDDVIPDCERISAIGDMAELEAIYDSERHLLYVACTRPRDRLLVTAVRPGSEFLGDILAGS